MMSRPKTDTSDKFYNLREGLETLCKRDGTARDHLARYLEFEDFSGSNRKFLLRDLSDLLWQREFTENVALCFPNILLELLIRAEQRNKGEVFHRYMCIALGKLVRVHPDAVRFALQYFEKHPSPFATGQDVKTPPKKRKFNDDHQKDDLDVVVACYNFLMISCEHFREIWDWSQFMELYFGHSDDLISWIACHCIAWVTGMNDYVRQHVLEQFMIPEAIRSCSLKFDNLQAAVHFKLVGEPSSSNAYDVQRMYKCPYFVTVAGIQLKTCGSPGELSIVPVSSTMSNLHSLALGVASNKAVCLQGPVGSGKTALVEQLAHMTGRALPTEQQPPHFIKVQLGDEIDSKMLLGTYRCTDIPGEFVWQPGVLTQAAINGYWILLEDFDTAVMDVASVVASLLETGTLSVPGYKDTLKVAPGFQLFVTQRTLSSVTGFHKPISNSSSLLEKHWFQINVEPLSKLELIEVVQTMFPVLETVASRMVKVFLLFSSGSHQSALNATEDIAIDDLGGLSIENQTHVTEASGRLISTRDLIKWCQRAIEGFDVRKADSALKVLQDGIDIFCCSVANAGSRLKLAISIASCLGVIKTKAEFFCQTYKPSINAMPNKFIAGRAFIAKQEASLWSFATTNKSSFAFTRPAACLLERVLCCVSYKEPVLLVGETGTGKTSVVQFLAERTNNHLLVINMNQQSDSSDLLGGYKPVDLKFIVSPVREEFEELFKSYFSVESNVKFLENIAKCFIKRKWSLLVRLMKQSYQAALARLENNASEELRYKKWTALGERLLKLESQINAQSALAFKFIEGSLVKALQKGYWVLLDEINLASAETLQCLSGLLEGSSASLYLLERGDREPVKRHSNFHLFACMNPATDVGKKDLPAGLRNRFTEFFVDELTEIPDLSLLVGTYLNQLSVPQDTIEKIVKFYLNVREEASKNLNDGTGGKPHYSLRTLCRALRVAATNPCGTVLRSLYEGLCLSFLTQLDHASHLKVTDMISKTVLSKGKTSILKQPLVKPVHDDNEQYVNFEGYWVLQGSLEPKVPEKYILTPSVRRNLHDLVRVVAIGHHPVLLQGETSVGKTSLITYLAKASGNHCVRINNHEHTDIQEYVGSYSADENGCLVFREGILVEAMRNGHWIILDELNLAPTDTQETVKADPRFMLFATQNPSGLYGGRKTLSRAFRNRFVELHFAEIPPKELETILEKRCQMPASYCKKLVAVMTELQLHRKGSAAFAGKQGFMTLRDLFRWGERYTLAKYQPPTKYYDWDQHLADEGYLVLAGRVRKSEEAEVISKVLEKHIKRKVDPCSLFTLNDNTSPVTREILEKVVSSSVPGFDHIVWTYNMRRLAVLVGKSCQFREPVLLVGETGCGKTTVCQLLSSLNKQKLFSVNCHMHTECADFLGGLRPVRDHNEEKQKLFEWVDGPLIKAMQEGGLFLADEISLADDSVLERMNSLLEPERTLLLAEKGTDGSQDTSLIVVAKENFLFIGTMNPGGDYGKKELSPALRNRFTEIWCQSCNDRDDLLAIIEHNLRPGLTLGNAEPDNSGVGSCMMDFIQWFTAAEIGKRFAVSVRDILAWVNFINVVTENKTSALNIQNAYVHGACLTFLDSFGSGVTSAESLSNLRVYQESCLKFLCQQVNLSKNELISGEPKTTEKHFGISPFFIDIGKNKPSVNDFTFYAPTTGFNALHVLRAMQLSKPILLEGSPGVGKTTLITALAKASGNNVIRINLSEQTDISDLFGADLPVEGGQGGQFAWRDGPLLRALKAGDWILLDELNLASQSVLEGLNACLDHRGEVFIPELDRSFQVKPGRTHLFGAQNPLRQGGARRGLPQSFLNRFTQVYIDALSDQDLEFIICSLYPMVPSLLVKKMVQFNGRLHRETTELHLWGLRGGPWELNLRDLTRWCQAMTRHCTPKESDMDIDFDDTSETNCNLNPGQFVDLIYVDRMRTFEDKEKVKEIYREEFGSEYPLSCDVPNVHVTQEAVYLGDEILPRIYPDVLSAPCPVSPEKSLLLLRQQYPALRSLARCVNMNWMSIIVGPSGSGKTCLVHLLSQLAGRELRVMAVNSAMDTTEILEWRTLAEETQRLRERAAELREMLEEVAASDEELRADADAALADVRLVEARVADDAGPAAGGPTAGGTFEWVDSLLVKCLRDGSWLLLDGANLCSPAVLDRLNALLEPGGVLTVGERGVGADGELVTVSPHPAFRLFLALDPRHGDISRAMRNRGVELYLPEQPLGALDMAALLAARGLRRHRERRALLAAHQAAADAWPEGGDCSPLGCTPLRH
ncbi:Dynein heavy chain, cytoplasmic [Gryllus bimaculatus]|nr:Dynein heavy chain, cytoplasmic [Gryllus bimaculatus]